MLYNGSNAFFHINVFHRQAPVCRQKFRNLAMEKNVWIRTCCDATQLEPIGRQNKEKRTDYESGNGKGNRETKQKQENTAKKKSESKRTKKNDREHQIQSPRNGTQN